MALTGLKFFGCTIKGLSTVLGLGTNKSSVRISLVEDTHLGDLFDPVVVGTPAAIEFGALKFVGLLQNHTKNAGPDGLYTYEVVLEDPRDILEGAKLILSDYIGTSNSVPNLFNVFGYYESGGFGDSEANDAGMSWTLVREAIEAMSLSATSYGGPLVYKGVTYSVDLSDLPIPPDNYRISGNDISLLQAIGDICQDGGCDYFIEIPWGTNIIRPRKISRTLQPPPGLLRAFIEAQTLSGNCVRSDIGKEARNDVCSSFLVGGQQTYIYANGRYLTYFGQTPANVPITGARTTANDPWTLSANLNSLEIADITGSNTYTANMLEMVAAAHSKEMWAIYMAANKNALATTLGLATIIRNPVDNGFNIGQAGINASWFAMTRANAATMVASLKDTITMWKTQRVYEFVQKAHNEYLGRKFLIPVSFVQRKVDSETGKISYSDQVSNQGYSQIPPLGLSTTFADLFGPGNGLYDAFCAYSKASIFETQEQSQSWELKQPYHDEQTGIEFTQETAYTPQDGYIGFEYDYVLDPNIMSENGFELTLTNSDDNEISKCTTFGLNAFGDLCTLTFYDAITFEPHIYWFSISLQTFQDVTSVTIRIYWESGSPTLQEQGFTMSLSEYTQVETLTGLFDLSKVSVDSYVSNTTQGSVHMKMNVQEKIYYIGAVPHVLVDVQNPPCIMPQSGYGSSIDIILRGFGLPADDASRNALNTLVRNYAGGSVIPKLRNLPVFPVGFAVPFTSNTRSYGPWYATGALGKTKYHKDNSLTPWQCGSVAVMNAVAEARVSEALTFQQEAESGSFELVGAPLVNLGDVAVASGPTVTSIEIGYSTAGVTTKYRCHTFSSRPGTFSKNNVDNMLRISRQSIENQKETRNVRNTNLRKLANRGNLSTQYVHQQLGNQFGVGEVARSSSVVITFYSDDSAEEGEKYIQGGVVPLKEALLTMRVEEDLDGYQKTASMSMEGLLRPISTHLYDPEEDYDQVDNMSMYFKPNPHYTQAVTVTDLDPFVDGNDIIITVKGDDLDDANNYLTGSEGQNTHRIVGLRGPVVISGWGRCVDDCWVPNANPETLDGDMLDGYLRKGHKWLSGPLDILWDGERGVWCAGTLMVGKTIGSIAASGGYEEVELYESATTKIEGRIKRRKVYNPFSASVPANTIITASFCPELNKWVLNGADCI